MIQRLVQREMMHEKGFIKNLVLRPLAATVAEADMKHANYAGLQGPVLQRASAS
jgi:hypothetical protein